MCGQHFDILFRNLIKVRCSLEDVAANHINSMRSRNEKDSVIATTLCEVLQKTGAALEIVMSAMFMAFKDNFTDKDQFDLIRVSKISLKS